MTSTYSGSVIRWPTAARSVVSMSCTASRGRPASASASATIRASSAVGLDGLGAAAQDRGVAALDAQGGGVDRHVGAALVDDADDTQRHAHAPDLDAGRPRPHVVDGADRIGQPDDLLDARRPWPRPPRPTAPAGRGPPHRGRRRGRARRRGHWPAGCRRAGRAGRRPAPAGSGPCPPTRRAPSPRQRPAPPGRWRAHRRRRRARPASRPRCCPVRSLLPPSCRLRPARGAGACRRRCRPPRGRAGLGIGCQAQGHLAQF